MTLNEFQMDYAAQIIVLGLFYRKWTKQEITRIVIPARDFIKLGQPHTINGIPVHCGTTAFVVELGDEDGHPKNRRTLQIA
jgi:hypothetical protein